MTDSTKTWLVAESKSLIVTFATLMLVDGQAIIAKIYAGDWSRAAWYSLGFLAVRSLVKALIKMIWPNAVVGAKS
jgi:hypothetical protein